MENSQLTTKPTKGTNIMNRLHDGSLAIAPTAYVAEIRRKVSTACEELLDVGARIRPLYVGEVKVGWVRGVHLTERKALQRWVYDDLDIIEQILLLGTSFNKNEISAMGATGRLLAAVIP